MIAKTSLGSNFSGALNYGAGISIKGKEIEGKSELLFTRNLLSDSPNEIAREMDSEASYSKCKKPVWHTSLSWPPDEKPTPEEMQKAADLYCSKIGANLEQHQVAVYRHFDQAHEHIHIYINRVANGVAISTSHNFAQNVRICKEISEELGFKKLPKKNAEHLRKVGDFQKEAQTYINKAIKTELKQGCDSLELLQKALEKKGITCRYKLEDDKLKSSSYQYQDINIKGQDVGFTSKKLESSIESNKTNQQQINQEMSF